MAVLLQYNVSTSWTATQLSDATGIKMDLLLQVISAEQVWIEFFIYLHFKQVAQILLKSKLLSSEDDENDLQQTSQLSLFVGYKK